VFLFLERKKERKALGRQREYQKHCWNKNDSKENSRMDDENRKKLTKDNSVGGNKPADPMISQGGTCCTVIACKK